MLREATDKEQARLMAVKTRLLESVKDEMLSGEITKAEFLCLFAHITGMLIAMQDQRTMMWQEAMDIVAENIRAGNASAIEQSFAGITATEN